MSDLGQMSELAPLREVIERYGLGAKKTLGQHFLLDLNITRKIARLADLQSDERALEIGPGPGGLTRAVLETGAALTAIERDTRCIEALGELKQAYPNFEIVEGDALAADELQLVDAPVKILSNLPYNISTELLIKWLKQPELWSRMVLMFQKEVADRILAQPGSKTYGRLSVIAQAASSPSHGFNLPARAFTPPPKVDSTVLCFDPPVKPPAALARLEDVTRSAFSQRRKMVRSSLNAAFGSNLQDALAAAEIPVTARAEEITVAQYLKLSTFKP